MYEPSFLVSLFVEEQTVTTVETERVARRAALGQPELK